MTSFHPLWAGLSFQRRVAQRPLLVLRRPGFHPLWAGLSFQSEALCDRRSRAGDRFPSPLGGSQFSKPQPALGRKPRGFLGFHPLWAGLSFQREHLFLL